MAKSRSIPRDILVGEEWKGRDNVVRRDWYKVGTVMEDPDSGRPFALRIANGLALTGSAGIFPRRAAEDDSPEAAEEETPARGSLEAMDVKVAHEYTIAGELKTEWVRAGTMFWDTELKRAVSLKTGPGVSITGDARVYPREKKEAAPEPPSNT